MKKIRRSYMLLLSMSVALSLSISASAAPIIPEKAPGAFNVQVSTQPSTVNFVLPANADDMNKDAVISAKTSSQAVATVTEAPTTSVNSTDAGKFGDITLLSQSRPTDFYNIAANGSYTGSFWTDNSEIFTNYYFSPNNSGKLYLNIQTSKEPSQTTTSGYVHLYSKDSNSVLTTSSVPVPGGTLVTFSNLDTNKFYYIGFGVTVLGKGYSAGITVYH